MKEFKDKLIGRLEEVAIETLGINKGQFAMDEGEYSSYCSLTLYDVKEQANQLAEEYNNDFCEWKQEDEEGFSNCRFNYQEIISDEVSGFVYCPYCGKKIKVAPYQPKGE